MCAAEYVLRNIVSYRKTSNHPHRPTMLLNALLPYIESNVYNIIDTIWMIKSAIYSLIFNLTII
jgi:hypothetical protein